MSIISELELNYTKEVYKFDKVSRQANGSVLLSVGNAVLLASVVSELDNPSSEDFVPLTVQYIEKSYAASKIPGGFIKRDGKPSDFETLTSRIIDRSLRPLFPQGYVYPTTITIMVLSVDEQLDFQVLALNAASAALYTSDLPINKSVCAVRVGLINDELIINPSVLQMRESNLDLYLAGSKEEILMIEMKSLNTEKNTHSNTNIICEEGLVSAIEFGQNHLNKSNTLYESEFKNAKKIDVEVKLNEVNISTELLEHIKNTYLNELNDAIKVMAKKERSSELKNIAILLSKSEFCTNNDFSFDELYNGVNIVKKEIVRDMIINENIRADGRTLSEVRPICIETNILPSAHSSCLFTRGETQSLVITTLGDIKDGQMYEQLQEKGTKTENFMVHYNFPGFSVGEAKPIFGVSRRELGHGNLAKRALQSSLPINYKDTIRLTSEILESNGSSSMATVCAGSLAMKAANINTSALVAGVAMGAIFKDDKNAILTDIMGLEDHDGDMDFKVAGTNESITALQMDIKLGGISLEFLQEALAQARNAITHILNIMQEAQEQIVKSDALPKIQEFSIEASKIFSVIGKGGLVIREITEKYNVKVDLNKDTGDIKVSGDNEKNISDCVNHINDIASKSKGFVKKEKIDFTKLYEEDEIVSGKVLRIVDFGAFVELSKGGEGLLHISKMSKRRVTNVKDFCDIDDKIEIKVLKVTKDRIELSFSEF